MATPIDTLTLSGPTWSTFGDLANTTNEIVVRINAIGTYDDITVSGGEINGTVIGNLTPSDATFENVTVLTTLDVSASSLILAPNQISGDAIYGGTAQINTIEINNTPTSANHATRKDYVDTSISDLRNEMIAYTLIFGG